MNPARRSIGVFDSGVGGLSVLREIQKVLPAENLIYVADSLHAPYGEKSELFILERANTIARFFLTQNVKAIVIACNTATAVAAAMLRATFALPIVAIEPAVKPAMEKTKSGIVGVMATQRTISSRTFATLVARHSSHAQVLVQPCPGLVEQIETGDLQNPETRALLEGYVRPLIEQGADTLVLGCTHYPFLAPLLQEIVGPGVTLLNPSAAVARELKRRLKDLDALEKSTALGHVHFWTSGSPQRVAPVLSGLWNAKVEVRQLTPD